MKDNINNKLNEFARELDDHLRSKIAKFWGSLVDQDYGGFYGFVDFDLNVERESIKGCILNSRILWFFSSLAELYKDNADYKAEVEQYLDLAKVAYDFLKDKFWDKENDGVYWSVEYNGKPSDSSKHCYNQAFAIYGLVKYYEVTQDDEALELANKLFWIIENKCRDKDGYLEQFSADFTAISNDKLSENGVIAERTMNTLLHVFEAYTELYRVTQQEAVEQKLLEIIAIIGSKIFNSEKSRQEVFFDKDYKPIIDLHSFGHDIETSWLLEYGLKVLNRDENKYDFSESQKIVDNLAEKTYELAFDGTSLANESENGVVDTSRIWWVQAEACLGFFNKWQRNESDIKYLDASLAIWEFIKKNVVDSRPGSEWFWLTDENGQAVPDKPIVEPWKCPYHNGRMCIEIIKRVKEREE